MSTIGGTIKLKGETEYRKALKDVQSNLKLLSSELKLTSSAFMSGDKSLKDTKTSYSNMNSTVQEQKAKISDLRKVVEELSKEYGENSDKVRLFKTQLNNAETQLNQMENATDKSNKELKEMKEATDDAGSGASRLGDIIKGNLISEGIIAGIKGLAGAMKQVSGALIDMGKQAIQSYAEYEQLVGGVDTLFKESSAKVQEYAENAYKTSGLSANAYMETVTSFSASLINSLNGDTVKSAEIADMAITDMSDNANKMGTSMEMIQNAYQGFAKQNYTMLDNLKLGYGGTKGEMERLLAKANEINAQNGIHTDYQISNYADVVQAIHVIQTEMGIMGTTSAEASGTISGSVGSMKASWQNLITGIADENANFEQLVNNFVNSLIGENGEGGAIGNLLPRITIALDGIVNLIVSLSDTLLPKVLEIGIKLIGNLATGIAENLPSIVSSISSVVSLLVETFTSMLPQLMSMGGSLVDNISSGLQENIPNFISKALDLIDGFANFLTENVPILITKGMEMLRNLVKGIMDSLPELISRVPEIISKFANVINDNAPTIIKGGFNIIMDIIKGIINAIPTLVANIPKIIQAILDVWTAFNWINLGKNVITAIGNGIKNMTSFAKSAIGNVKDSLVNTVKNLPQNLFNIGKNMISGLGNAISSLKTWVVGHLTSLGTSMLTGIKNVFSLSNIKSIGSNLIKGLWNGISDMTGWILNKISDFCGGVINKVKKLFGINSPSKVFKEEIGTNLALGVGEGFSDTMINVSKDMANAIPTEFDTNINYSSNTNSNYDMYVNAFKDALKDVKVVMNDRELGTFVTDTMERVVYN